MFVERDTRAPTAGKVQHPEIAGRQRFIMVRPVRAGRPSRLILVRNLLSGVESAANR